MTAASGPHLTSMGKKAFFVALRDENTPLPGEGYIRVVGKCANPSAPGREVHCHYALQTSGARHCRLVEALLDAADLDVETPVDTVRGPIPPLVLPQATDKGCEKVFQYLQFLLTRLPSIISRPLRSPLEECIQPWELSYVMGLCFPDGPSNVVTSNDAFRKLLDGHSNSLDLLLEVAMLSDFLMIEPLCDLTCAFLASLGLSANSESELLRLWGHHAPLTEEQLQPVYEQLPFLKPGNSG